MDSYFGAVSSVFVLEQRLRNALSWSPHFEHISLLYRERIFLVKDFWSRELRSEIFDLKIWYQGRNDFKVQFYFRPNYQRSRIKGHLRSFLGQRFNFKIKLLYYHIIIIILFLIILSKTLKKILTGYLLHVLYPKMKFNPHGVGNENFK